MKRIVASDRSQISNDWIVVNKVSLRDIALRKACMAQEGYVQRASLTVQLAVTQVVTVCRSF